MGKQNDENNPDRRPAVTGHETQVGAKHEYYWPMPGGLWLKVIIANDEITAVSIVTEKTPT